MLVSGLELSPRLDITEETAPEAVVCVLGDAFFLQSSEFVEDVEVGVIGTALLLLLPEHDFILAMFFGLRFLV